MRRFSTLLLFIFALPAFAQQPPTPEQLLDAVHKNADLSAAGPYTLTATVIGNPGDHKTPQTGQLRIDRDHDRFRVELDMPGGYREVRLILGDKRYVPRDKATLFVTDLNNFDRNWDPLREYLIPNTFKTTYGKVSSKKIHGQKALCFDQIRQIPGAKAPGKVRYCVDAERSVLLRRDAGDSNSEFFDYTSVAGHMLPRRVTIHKPLLTDLDVRDISVAYQPVDPARLVPPAQSVELETCAGEQQPNAVFTPSPPFSEQAKREHHHPTVMLHAFIAADGSVQDALVLTPTSDGLDVNAANTVNTWKFTPAICSGRPVMTEMTIEVSYRLQ